MAFPLGALALGYKNLHHWHAQAGRSFTPPASIKKGKKAPKTLIVGWDAGDWDFINPLLGQGKMPGLQKLIEHGSRGKLASMRPMLSPMLWTTIATGKRPFAHGIHGFVEKSLEGKIQPVSGRSRTAAAFWDILGNAGYKCQVVGWWPSHPAEPINGQMVSNLYHQGDEPAPGFAFPKALEKPLTECRIRSEWITADLIEPFIPGASNMHPSNYQSIRSTIKILANALSVQMAATYLLHHYPTDVHAVYFDALDHFSHLGIRENPEFTTLVEGAYRLHDRMLEGLLEYCDEHTDIIVLSDHGFQRPDTKLVHLPDEPMAPERDHRFYGMLLASGPSFYPLQSIHGASIADITPTLLSIMNVPVAKDMHGRVLKELLMTKSLPNPVNSYDSLRKTDKAESKSIPAPYLEHLIELGYIYEKVREMSRNALDENHFHLARSYADALDYDNTVAVLKPLIGNDPPARYLSTYIHALINTGNFAEAKRMLNKHRDDIQIHIWQMLQAMTAMGSGHLNIAVDILKNITPPETENTAWCNLIGRMFQLSGAYGEAENLYRKSMIFEPGNPGALFGFALAKYHQGDKETALEYFLDATEQQFFAPQTHYYIGKILLELGNRNSAKNALRISMIQQPKNKALQAFYFHHFPDNKPSGKTRVEKKPVIVVSGLPRSGTSLAMQLLREMGIPLFTDNTRIADEFNPKGYFEHQAVKKLPVDNTFLTQASGKAIKITSPVLPLLSPASTYQVIVMQRDIDSCMASQLYMRGVKDVPFALREQLRRSAENALEFCRNNKGWIRYTEVSFENLLQNPETEIQRISAFLNIPYQSVWKKVVQPDLNRFNPS
jgi:predicted AlkP superfamily phosphohydrolase/phosphomutase/Flp pilus assembly protein TadD